MARIVFIGEGMLELAQQGSNWGLGYGGDTLNSAIHMARLSSPAIHQVGYLSALGRDPFSAELRRKWQAEGLDTALVLDDPVHGPGLYAITTDARGERSFTYWRDSSAARRLFDLPGIEAAVAQAEAAELLCFSLISLAILPAPGRRALLHLCRRTRARGGTIAFDGNFRPLLWRSRDEARQWHDAAIACADIGLPTLDDEIALHGIENADAVEGADTVARAWQARGCGEVVVKLGSAGCRLPDGAILAPDVIHVPIDTSGAGDAFNAAYLDARLLGESPETAARAGHALAGWTILRPGGIPARDSFHP